MLSVIGTTVFAGITFLNSGTVQSADNYSLYNVHSIENEDYSYEGVFGSRGEWKVWSLPYLYKNVDNNTRSVPPSGMRSSVPLGGFASGGIELRADGRIGDWGTSLNNGPESHFARKVEDNNWMMGISLNSKPVLVRTHPPSGVDRSDAVSKMTYRGSFPVSQLLLEDSRVDGVTLNAYSHFEMNSPENSALPAVNFEYSFPGAVVSDTKAVFMNVPESLFRLSGVVSVRMEDSTVIMSGGVNNTAGEFAVTVLVDGAPSSSQPTWVQSDSVASNWNEFKTLGGELPNQKSGNGQVGIAVTVPSGQNVTFIFGYYFPTRYWDGVDIGQYYSTLWGSAKEVVKYSATNIASGKTAAAITAWNRLCTDNSLPDWLKDALTQTGGSLGKTSMFLKDGRFRQFESHSCAQMEPPHIHFYRALLYTHVFPTLEQQTLDMYATVMGPDGDVQESYGCSCGGCGKFDLDVPNGGPRGDDTSLFLIDNYMNYKWHGKSLTTNWDAIIRAFTWVIGNAKKFGLPSNLRNTFDEHQVMGNTNSYSAFVFLTGMAVAKEMAHLMNNDTMYSIADAALTQGNTELDAKLWTGDYYRSFWCANGNTDPNALQGDSLYGYLWSAILGVDIGVDKSKLRSHTEFERKQNLNPYGIMFASNRTFTYNCSGKGTWTGMKFDDINTWTMMSLDHASVGVNVGSNISLSMDVAQRMIDSYRLLSADQWDIRDLSSQYPDAIEAEPSRPACNAHYTRQNIMWAIPMMLSGQQWDFNSSTLSLNPVDVAFTKLPVFASGSSMIVAFSSSNCITLEVLSTQTESLSIQNLVVKGDNYTSPGTLKTGDVNVFCKQT